MRNSVNVDLIKDFTNVDMLYLCNLPYYTSLIFSNNSDTVITFYILCYVVFFRSNVILEYNKSSYNSFPWYT